MCLLSELRTLFSYLPNLCLGQGFSQGEFSVDLLPHGDFLPCAYYSTAENANPVWFLLLFVLVGLSGETEPIGYIYTRIYVYLYVYMYICVEIYCECLAHPIMEIEQSRDLPSASSTPRRAGDVIPFRA